MKKLLQSTVLACALILPGFSQAADYVIDTPGMHAFVQFRIQHLGYSWLYGRFNRFEGRFSFDENNPSAAHVDVTIDMASIDSNHAERDKHLRDRKYLNVGKYATARFVSTRSGLDADGNGTVDGELTLYGQTRPLTLTVEGVGAGRDPWGGYRRGFEATASLQLADFGMDFNLGQASERVELMLSVEGVRQ